MFVEMTDAGTTSETTSNHKYHIHMKPVGDDYMSDNERCASTGGHWNPFDVAVEGNVLVRCSCNLLV